MTAWDDDHGNDVDHALGQALQDALAGEASGVPTIDGPMELVLGRSAARTRRQRAVAGLGAVAVVAASVGGVAWSGRSRDDGMSTQLPGVSAPDHASGTTTAGSGHPRRPVLDPLDVRLGTGLSDATLDFAVDHTMAASPRGTAGTAPGTGSTPLDAAAARGTAEGTAPSYRADPSDPGSAWFSVATYALPVSGTSALSLTTVPSGAEPAALATGTGWFEAGGGDVRRLVFARPDGSSGAVVAFGVEGSSMVAIVDSLALGADHQLAPVPVPTGFVAEPEGAHEDAPATSLASYTTRRGRVDVAVVQGSTTTLMDIVRASLPTATRVRDLEVRGHQAVLLSDPGAPGTYSVWWHAAELGAIVRVRVVGPEQLAVDAASQVVRIEPPAWAEMATARPPPLGA